MDSLISHHTFLNTMLTPMPFHTLNQPLRNALLLLVLPKMRNAITMP